MPSALLILEVVDAVASILAFAIIIYFVHDLRNFKKRSNDHWQEVEKLLHIVVGAASEVAKQNDYLRKQYIDHVKVVDDTIVQLRKQRAELKQQIKELQKQLKKK